MGNSGKGRGFWRGVILLVVSIGFVAELQAQNSLYIFKPGKKERYEYHVGSYIAIRPKQNFPVKRGTIYQISDSSIYFSAFDSLKISAIEAVLVNEDPRLFGKGFWWKNMAVTTGALSIWQIMYLVNQGELSPDVKSVPYIIAFTGFVPLAINGVIKLVTRSEVEIGPDDWRIGTIVLK